jgi:hypothetical protein
MNQFESVSRPVIFEHDDPNFSYWGKGSSFLISNASNFYWVTAAHVLKNLGGCVDSVRIFPSDGSRISLPFNEKYTINKGSTDDEEYKDVFVARIDLARFDTSGDAPLVAQDIEQGLLSATQLKPNDELWVIGYPAESNFIDYDFNKIKNTRSVLRAIYLGESTNAHCHELLMETSVRLDSYDGLSGSPVYFLKPQDQGGKIVKYPMLVGMLIRGTASSRIAHFVNSDVLSNVINLAECECSDDVDI